jgi:hypothetical protein
MSQVNIREARTIRHNDTTTVNIALAAKELKRKCPELAHTQTGAIMDYLKRLRQAHKEASRQGAVAIALTKLRFAEQDIAADILDAIDNVMGDNNTPDGIRELMQLRKDVLDGLEALDKGQTEKGDSLLRPVVETLEIAELTATYDALFPRPALEPEEAVA